MKKREKKKGNSRGQIWIETVLYTLIAFVMIGLVLAFAKPQIEKLQDKAILDQSVELMKNIDSVILTIGAPGNQRLVELGIKKGELIIDGENDLIEFKMESRQTYSEPGVNVSDGNLIIYTEKTGNFNLVTLTRNYSGEYDITYQGNNQSRTISKTATSYKMIIANKGGETTIIDFKI